MFLSIEKRVFISAQLISERTVHILLPKYLMSWYIYLGILRADARNIPSAACVAPPEDEQVMLETCRGL
jgi:hypothetical protein